MWELLMVLILLLVGSSHLEGFTNSAVAKQAGTIANLRESIEELKRGPLIKTMQVIAEADKLTENAQRLQSSLVTAKAAKVPSGYS